MLFSFTDAVHCVFHFTAKLTAAALVEAVAASEEALFSCAGCYRYNSENDCKKQNQHQYLDFNTNSFHFLLSVKRNARQYHSA